MFPFNLISLQCLVPHREEGMTAPSPLSAAMVKHFKKQMKEVEKWVDKGGKHDYDCKKKKQALKAGTRFLLDVID